MKVKRSEVAQSCPTLCDSMDCNLSGSSVHGIFQAVALEWIAISFSRGSSRPRDRTQVSRIVDTLYRLSHQGSPKPQAPLGKPQLKAGHGSHKPTRMGFKPTHAEHNGLAVHRLNHLATLSWLSVKYSTE